MLGRLRYQFPQSVEVAQLVERWFEAPKVMGSKPIFRTISIWVSSSAVEQEAVNFQVVGSIPTLPSNSKY